MGRHSSTAPISAITPCPKSGQVVFTCGRRRIARGGTSIAGGGLKTCPEVGGLVMAPCGPTAPSMATTVASSTSGRRVLA